MRADRARGEPVVGKFAVSAGSRTIPAAIRVAHVAKSDIYPPGEREAKPQAQAKRGVG
jgi:hypothetical protein